jgi:hypothetical protein
VRKRLRPTGNTPQEPVEPVGRHAREARTSCWPCRQLLPREAGRKNDGGRRATPRNAGPLTRHAPAGANAGVVKPKAVGCLTV